MGSITAQSIADKAELVLLDSTNVRWSESELLGWLNSGQRAIFALKPNCNVSTVNLSLVEGSKQSLSSTYYSLVAVVRNMGSGSTPGPGIFPMDRAILDVAMPDWHLAAYANATVKGFSFDEKDLRTFYVYPAQPASTTQQVEAKVTSLPTDVASLATAISIDDIYEGPLLDYVLFRAFAKDTYSAPSAQRSVQHFNSFVQALGIQNQVEQVYAPEKEDLGGRGGSSQVEL